MSKAVRTLITNDDGISSPGLRGLAVAAREQGLDIVVAAPATESSGSSAAITAGLEDGKRIALESRTVEGLEGIRCYAVGAAPALIALIAAHGAFGEPPELVLSGINRGANLGRAILHSGTVGAALTAGVNQSRGLAVSLDVGMTPRPDPCWTTAARFTCRVLPFLVHQPIGTVLNLNVPDLEFEHVRGLRAAPLAPFGIVQTTMTEHGDDHVRLAVADNDDPMVPGTDAACIAEGYASITTVRSVCEADQSSLTDLVSSNEEHQPPPSGAASSSAAR